MGIYFKINVIDYIVYVCSDLLLNYFFNLIKFLVDVYIIIFIDWMLIVINIDVIFEI